MKVKGSNSGTIWNFDESVWFCVLLLISSSIYVLLMDVTNTNLIEN